MKKLMISLALVMLFLGLKAQAPQGITHQAVIRNATNDLVTNQAMGIRVSILQGSEEGSTVYVETHSPTSNAHGLITYVIGNGTPTLGNFAEINWPDGPYFLKTEADPEGGTNYSITGTMQFLSVPYAFFSDISGDNQWRKKEPHIFNINTGNVGIGTEKPIAQLHTTGSVRFEGAGTPGEGKVLTSDANGTASWQTETDPSVPVGTQPGEMQYWDGSAWITVPPGNEGQVLSFIGGIPTWIVPADDVFNPATGKIWMDRNLGATQVATSSTDASAYGHLYQWGRGTDGHQVRTSGTTNTLSSSDTPGHSNFILPAVSPYDWRSPQNDELWQGVSGINNPCPAGYRLPTEAEWEAERLSWSSNDAAGAFASPLKLTLAGYRNINNGLFDNVGSDGYYWSSSVSGNSLQQLYVGLSVAYSRLNYRALGFSVRCIKD